MTTTAAPRNSHVVALTSTTGETLAAAAPAAAAIEAAGPHPTRHPTRRVARLRARLSEHHDVLLLQDDPAWTTAHTPRTIRERSKAATAARLHVLYRDPARRALSATRWRRGITAAAGIGLVLALSVSTGNVQATVADGAPPGSGVWWFAWTVEPAIAVLLLSLFAFRAFMATRGETVQDPWITRTEWALLGTTFTLNAWLGVSAESQRWAQVRLPQLAATPAVVRFASCEPLLGGLDIRPWLDGGLDWVIAGGESGPGARPMHPDWARGLRDQCQAAEVAFFFKQWGAWRPAVPDDAVRRRALGAVDEPASGGDGGSAAMVRVGKGKAGRELDGRMWDQFPQRRAEAGVAGG